MVDWYDTLAEPLAAAEHGIADTDAFFGSVHDGPLNFNSIDYPAAQVYIDNFERRDGTTWTVAFSTTLYFEWSRETSTREDVLHPLAAVMESTLAALSDVECITDYHPARIDFFAGEPVSSLVLAVSVQFRVTTLTDPGTFDGE
jgi:hypothetical protein